MPKSSSQGNGSLALIGTGKSLPLQVLSSRAGHYIGTADHFGPVSRESVEYYPTQQEAMLALTTGTWTQRCAP